MNTKEKKLLKAAAEITEQQERRTREWYTLRPILGCANWALFMILLGGREAGKSYSITDFFCRQFKSKGIPFYWLRLTLDSCQKLLQNNAEKLIDPDLRRKYNLDLITKGEAVYHVTKRTADGKVKEKKLLARVLAISTFYSDKGAGFFDKDFLNDLTMRYNICLDEFQKEKNEKSQGDIAYQFVNELENILRSTKTRTRIFLVGNTLEEASDILKMFNFIPEKFGIFKLVKNKKLLMQYLKERDVCKTSTERDAVDKKYENVDFGKRAVVDYMEPSDSYLRRRKGTVADILMGDASTFTNKIDFDKTLIYKGKLKRPVKILVFGKEDRNKFTVWESEKGLVIAEYNKERIKTVISMRPYLDQIFNHEIRDEIIEAFDCRAFLYKNLITNKKFQSAIQQIKPRKNG